MPAVPSEKCTDMMNDEIHQMQMLDRFCNRIKVAPLEVLKLNREKKWQTRFLTVSKEGSWLNAGEVLPPTFCPLGIMWVKKLIKGHSYSIVSIDNSGKGGGLFSHLERFDVQGKVLEKYPFSKKQRMKFYDCVIVRLYFKNENRTFVTLACTKSSSEAIMAGCSAIIEILNKHSRSLPIQQLQEQLEPKMQFPPVKIQSKANPQTFTNIQQNQTKAVKSVGVKVARSPVVAKSLSGQGAPHLWEA